MESSQSQDRGSQTLDSQTQASQDSQTQDTQETQGSQDTQSSQSPASSLEGVWLVEAAAAWSPEEVEER